MITFTLSYKERVALTYALAFYQSNADAFTQKHWNVDEIAIRLSRTKCGDPSCQYCGDDPVRYGWNE